MSHRVAIIAALEGELKPLVRHWARQPDGAWLLQRGALRAIAVAKGMGASRAKQSVELAETYGQLDALVSIGWAGGTSCGVQPGCAYEIGEVIDRTGGARFATEAVTSPIKLATTDRVAGREEKRRLAETLGASLVDMEAATVARLAHERGIPFSCWKAVTDVATEEIPNFNAFLDAEGQLRTWALSTYVLWHPKYAPALLRMGRNSRSGAQALAAALERWMREGRYGHSNGTA